MMIIHGIVTGMDVQDRTKVSGLVMFLPFRSNLRNTEEDPELLSLPFSLSIFGQRKLRKFCFLSFLHPKEIPGILTHRCIGA